MSEHKKNQAVEVIAKEITIALIQKAPYGGDKLLDYTCDSFERVYNHLVKTCTCTETEVE
jgi:hypothetical protein